VVENLTKRASSREDRFPKTLFALSRCRIADDDGSRVLLSRSQVHVDEHDEVASAAQQQKRQNLDVLVLSWLLVFFTIFVAAVRIYREDLPRVTTSHNQVCLSLSKRIRHGLVAKINDKRRPQAREALSQISTDYSRARRAPAPIASPCLATPRPSEASERAHVFPPFSSPPYTCKCIESNPLYK
jgi:hypothetical protein